MHINKRSSTKGWGYYYAGQTLDRSAHVQSLACIVNHIHVPRNNLRVHDKLEEGGRLEEGRRGIVTMEWNRARISRTVVMQMMTRGRISNVTIPNEVIHPGLLLAFKASFRSLFESSRLILITESGIGDIPSNSAVRAVVCDECGVPGRSLRWYSSPWTALTMSPNIGGRLMLNVDGLTP